MPPTSRSTNEYYVFLASPGDVNPERQAVRDFFDDYNTTTASPRGLRFIVIDWENCSTSGFGRPQELITNQTFERHHDSLVLVIGIMGQRFGSPSGTHESGTEEEFEWALQHRLRAGWPELKWFFRKVEQFEAPSDPEKILEAFDQWKKVRAFRERLDKEKTLYFKEFLDIFNFRDVLRRDLSLWLNASEHPWKNSTVMAEEADRVSTPILSFEHESGQLGMDRITPVYEFDSLALQEYRDCLRDSKLSDYPKNLSDSEFLYKAGYMKEARLTVAGVLLFSRSPANVLPLDLSSAIVQCTAYAGDTKASERAQASFEGPLLSQLFNARDFIARHIKAREKITESSMQSIQLYEYPMKCIRELIANALCHRDYGNKGRISYIRLYTDRIEISNPGSWVGSNARLTEGEVISLRELEGQPIQRNMRLARAISAVNVMEMEGSGIPTSVQDCEDSEAEVPSVAEQDGYVVVTVYPRKNWADASGVISSAPVSPVLTADQRAALLCRYLEHVIGRSRYLQLQGIRSGGRLVNIDLDQIYITLKATRTRTLAEEETWLAEERQLAPGEAYKLQHTLRTETVVVKVEEALAEHKHLVVLGDPGSGKTTLLRYLALCYARDCAEDGSAIVRERLGLLESGFLPVLLPLRNLGSYLQTYHLKEDGTEGHERLLAFLRAYLSGERLAVPHDFFDADLHSGRVVLLFDGMDEVGDFDLRRRVARLIESLATAYPACRMVVTSRIVGYTGATRLGDGFATTTVRDFTLADVREFLTHWHRLVAIGQMGENESAEHFAADQTAQLMKAIEANPRVRELAINPLMLTVIALVHRDRVELPERRAELYAEAIDVLLGKWDAARGVPETRILDDRPFDTGDRRLLLQSLALAMHETEQKEIATDELEKRLCGVFAGIVQDSRAADGATKRFLRVAQERTGLLVEAGQGVYRFSHLTFQEYLAAVEVAERDDSIAYTLRHTADAFWREAILLEAGYLSTKNRAKTTRLIQAIADSPTEPEPFHNLVLAAECVRDVGSTRVEGDLATLVRQRLQAELERPLPQEEATWLTRLWGKVVGTAERRRVLVSRRIAAATALSRIEGGSFGAAARPC